MAKVNPKALQQVVNDMATSMDQSRQTMDSLVRTLEEMNSPAEKAKRIFKEMSNSVLDIADSLDDTISKYKQINTLATRFNRLTDEELSDRKAVVKLLEISKREMEAAAKALENDAVAAGKVNKQVEAITKAIAAANDESQDLRAALDDVRQSGLDAAKAVKGIDMAKPIRGAEALGDALGKALSGVKALDNYGFKGLIGQLETTRNKVKSFRDEVKKNAVTGRQNMLGQFGTTKMSELGSKWKGLGTQAEKDSMIRMLSGKTGASGWIDRKVGGLAMRGAAGEAGLLGRGAAGLMGMGGGSVIGGLGAVASRVALPAAIITGILQVLQKGFDRNKEVYGALGGGGLVGGGPGGLRAAYTGWNDVLTSRGTGFGSGTGRFYDMDFTKSLDAMKEVVESGLAVQNERGAIHEGRNIDQVIAGGRATDIYSGVMRNAAMFGKPIGMDSTEAARESMKLMKDFSLSMGEVEDMFINIHKSVQSTGISTSKYLELVNGITSQFDKFNKSLNYTVSLVAALGKGAKYTADDLQGMVKGLMGEKKDLVTSAFGYQMMGRGGQEGLVKGYEQQAAMTRDELRKQKGFEKINESTTPEEILRLAKQNGDQSTMQLAQRYTQEQTRAGAARRLMGRGGEGAIGLAALQANMGGDPRSAIATQLSLLDVAMRKSGGSLMDFRQSNAGQVGRVQDALSNPILTKLSEMLGLNIAETQRYMTQTMSQMAEEVERAGKGDKEAAERLGLSADDVAKLRAQLDKGVKAGDTDVFKDLFQKSGMARMATTISEEARKTTQAAAEKNQRFLTGPLDYIQKALAALVENVIRLLSNLASLTAFFMKSDYEKEEKQAEYAKGFANGQETAKHTEMDRKTLMSTYDGAARGLGETTSKIVKLITDPDTGKQISTDTQGRAGRILERTQELADVIRKAQDAAEQSLGPKASAEAIKKARAEAGTEAAAKWEHVERRDAKTGMPTEVTTAKSLGESARDVLDAANKNMQEYKRIHPDSGTRVAGEMSTVESRAKEEAAKAAPAAAKAEEAKKAATETPAAKATQSAATTVKDAPSAPNTPDTSTSGAGAKTGGNTQVIFNNVDASSKTSLGQQPTNFSMDWTSLPGYGGR